MARRRSAKAGAGLVGAALLVLIALWTGRGAGRGTGPTNYTTPPLSVPAAAPPDETGERFYVHGPLNVRAQPNRDARVVRTLGRGDQVRLGPRDANGWARLYGPGAEGYVYRASDLVRTDPPAEPPLPARGGSEGSREYHRGPRGGCYTYTASGNRNYVDRELCD